MGTRKRQRKKIKKGRKMYECYGRSGQIPSLAITFIATQFLGVEIMRAFHNLLCGPLCRQDSPQKPHVCRIHCVFSSVPVSSSGTGFS